MALNPRQSSYSRYREYFLRLFLAYSKKEDAKMFLELALSLATLSFFLAFVLRPTVLTISQLFQEIESKKEIKAKMDQKIQNLSQAQTLLERESSRIALLDSAIPGRPFPETYIGQLEKITEVSGLSISSLSVNEALLVGNEEGGEKSVSLSFSLSGSSFVSFLNFLSTLESTRRPLLLESISLNSVEDREIGKSLNLVGSGKIPYLK
ncbi:hypothetical protein HY008_00705 [Candidatus Woesebacteria bacterium]|nr:hypothetical protein [Candidatus Woesebacteria bacterium]